MFRARYILFVFGLFSLVTLPAVGQDADHEVRGTVVAESDSSSLPGVNVVVKGTTMGTATDASGEYSLTVPSASDTLVFSYVGYETEEVPIEGRSVVDVQLQDTEMGLEELVVLGYSTRRQREMPVSVSQVDASDLEGITTPDITSRMQGRIPGVHIVSGSGEPGAGSQIRIRGTGSISASSDPLYVVDGVIGGSADPNDVESISVLKDAAATALYGSRAANGVVVITTKSGAEGPTQVNVRTSVGLNTPDYGNFEIMNSRELYEYHMAMGNPLGISEDILERDTDWRDHIFRETLTNETAVSVSGGDEQTRFYVSGNHYFEEGVVVSTGLRRFGGRANLEHDVSDAFSVSTRINGRYQTQQYNPAPALNDVYRNLPWDEPYRSDGSLRTGSESEWIGREQRNVLHPLQYNWSDGRDRYLNADVRLDYQIAPWLSFATTNRASFSEGREELYYDARTQDGSANEGELDNSESFSRSLLTSNQFDADYSPGDHILGAIAGFEYEENYTEGIAAEGIGIFPGLSIMDVAAEANNADGYKAENAFISGFFQGNYSYRDRYSLLFSYRIDGSSRFGEDNRYGNFYSLAGAWTLSEESFLESAEFIDDLRLRASYGTTGNAEIGNYQTRGLYGFSAQYVGQPAGVAERLANPQLTWEVAHTANIGLDLNLFERVELSVEAYRRVNQDLLQNVPLPGTSGFDSRIENIGSVRNQGVELELSTVNFRGSFEWTSDFNLSVNRNRVLELHEGEDILRGQWRIIEGRDMYTWYQRRWLGVDPETGDPLWERLVRDEEGNVTEREATSDYNEATLQPVGSASPDFTGGFGNTFSYAGFSLSTFVTFVYGNDVYYASRQSYDSDGAYITFNQMKLYDGWTRWEEPGDEATHPRVVPGGNAVSNRASSRYLEDGSFLRLQSVRLSYQLPSNLTESLAVQSAQLFVSGENLYTLTNFSGIDPEVELGGTIDNRYPNSRKLLVGINVNL